MAPFGQAKDNESPAERKARLALERARANETNKQRALLVKLANAIVSKISPQIVSLQNLVAKEMLPSLAPLIKDPVESQLQEFLEMDRDAKRLINSDGEGTLMFDDLKHVSSLVATSKKHQALAIQMIATLARVQPA